MRIGIDANCWANKRGYGRYTRELVSTVLEIDTSNSYTLFIDAQTERQCAGDLPSRARRVIVPTRSAATDAAAADGHRSLSDLWAMSRAVSSRSAAFDLFYFPTVYTFFPVPRRLKPLVTIHDTIAERRPALVFPHWRNRLFWTLKVGWAVRQASLILTVSDTAKSAVRFHFGLDDCRVRVVSDAVSPDFRPTEDTPERRSLLAAVGIEPGQRFLLYVGGISPHKSIETLVDAYGKLAQEDAYRDLRLVLIGDYKRDVFFSSYESLRQRLGASGVDASKVIFTGFVPDADLRHWYSAAQALVLPSLDEGFGLPAIEAMACGTPVVASRGGALPEVVGDAGCLFEPRDVSALATSLKALLSDDSLRQALSSKGLARAAQFTWRASARTLIDAFEEVGTQSQSA
ncbi:MAG: glycosyltransferase family 1 protein [Vicinamibacterales bacterium]